MYLQLQGHPPEDRTGEIDQVKSRRFMGDDVLGRIGRVKWLGRADGQVGIQGRQAPMDTFVFRSYVHKDHSLGSSIAITNLISTRGRKRICRYPNRCLGKRVIKKKKSIPPVRNECGLPIYNRLRA
jgi:hypothetical protein